jgi:hypothetical protein
MTPRTASWHGDDLFVALDAPSGEDVIRSFTVGRRAEVTQWPETPAGLFLTDIEANEDGLFAATIDFDTSVAPPVAMDQIRVYQWDGSRLTLDASAFTATSPRPPQPNFKQLSTGPARRPNDRHVIVSEFFGGWVRSLTYTREP